MSKVDEAGIHAVMLSITLDDWRDLNRELRNTERGRTIGDVGCEEK